MRRDELRQPLRKRGLAERLWAARPTLLQTAAAVTFLTFAGFSAWLLHAPQPLDLAEPIVTLAIPPAETITTATLAPPKLQEDSPANENAGDETLAPEPADAAAEPVDNQIVDTGATIIVAPRRPLA